MAAPAAAGLAGLLQALVPSFNRLELIKYFEVSALTCALYDHSLTISDELETMWTRKVDLSTVVYFVMRYGIDGVLLYMAYLFSGFTTLSQAVMYAIYHHYYTWDRRKGALVALVAALLATFIPALCTGLSGVGEYRRNTIYLEFANICLPPSPSRYLVAAWACTTSFDALAVIIVTMNAFHRPYRNQSDIFSSFRDDGVIWFLTIFGLRVLNVAMVGAAPAPSTFTASYHVWALMSIIQGRFILRTEMARRHKEGVRGDVLPIQKVSANDLELSTLPPYRPRDMDMDFS